jgi:hypothetical protein
VVGLRTPEGILMAAEELGLTDVQKGRLMQIAERARKDAEAVLTPQQQAAFAKLAEALPAHAGRHAAAGTPPTPQYAAHGFCQCPHCVAAKQAAAVPHASH